MLASPDVLAVHRSIPQYDPTPLIELSSLSRELGVARILLKDESQRFGLRAFKALGATYAIYRFIGQQLHLKGKSVPSAKTFYAKPSDQLPNEYAFCTATDGNHGRGVAWVARMLNQRAVVFMPHGSVNARVEAIELEGADVIIVDGNYDDAVKAAIGASETNGWQMISDTSWPGYEQTPRWISAGYTTMFREIEDDDFEPDIVLVQSGVGALAGAAGWYYTQQGRRHRPKLVCVESKAAACLFESASSGHGQSVTATGHGHTIMAGLNCGTPSPVAWPIIRSTFEGFISIGEDNCRSAMNRLRSPLSNDQPVDTGESGAAGLAGLMALLNEESLAVAREHLNISPETTILLLNTEGDTGAATLDRALLDQ